MNRLVFFFTIMSVLFLSCQRRLLVIGEFDENQDYAYTLEGASKYHLPNSIANDVDFGKIIVHVFISNEGRLKGFNIAKIFIKKNDNNNDIEYTNASINLSQRGDYPNEILPFFDFLSEKVIRQENIEKGAATPHQGDYLLRIPFRILD